MARQAEQLGIAARRVGKQTVAEWTCRVGCRGGHRPHKRTSRLSQAAGILGTAPGGCRSIAHHLRHPPSQLPDLNLQVLLAANGVTA